MDEFYPKCYIINNSMEYRDGKDEQKVIMDDNEMNQNNAEEFK